MRFTLHISGLPSDFNSEETYVLCEDFGEICDVQMESSKNGVHKFAYVEFLDEWDAQDAQAEIDGLLVEGSYLRAELLGSALDYVG